jgi:predicted permease
MQQIVTEHPDSHRGMNQITLDPLWKSPFGAGAYLYGLLPMLLAIAGIVLLLACTNVANLLLIKSVARRRELAIRLSMGASRGRLIRQLLLESLLLSIAGGAVAVWLTSWTAETFAYFVPPTSNGVVFNIKVDYWVLLATLSVSVLSGALFGILPALRSSSLAPVTVLKEEATSMTSGGRKLRLSDGLVIAQIALSMLMLVCAGLFIRSLLHAQSNDPGFDSNGVLLASMDLRTIGYTPSAGIEFERQLLAKIEGLPGVVSATFSNWVPMGSGKHTETIDVEGYVPRPHESMDVQRANVGPNFFRTLRIPLAEGRDITEQDMPKSSQAIVVNQALADRYWPGQKAIGKRIRIREQWRTVVGVSRNSIYARMKEGPQPQVFIPQFQDFYQDTCILTRTTGDPQSLIAAVEKTVHEMSADLALYGITTLKSTVRLASILEQIAATVVGILGVVALALATVGIYGVVAYTTSRRTREVGIRIALGASKAQIYQLVLSQGLRLVIIGLTVGIALALALARYLRSMLFGVTDTDLLTFVAVAILLTVVALAACCIPARRAANTETTWALRYE